MTTATFRCTVAQALVRFLTAQYIERDGDQQRFFVGCFGIFGHGNVAGIGQALLQDLATTPPGQTEGLRYYHARNEQAMVHTAVGYARMKDRLQTFACTTSVGPGATNMVTGAALATINRLPVLLLPGDVFATRTANPVLQELEDPRSMDVSVNDSFRAVSRYWDRINRPEQLPAALLAATRVLTDPVETGAVTLCLPQDVQAEAYDWPAELFAPRVWHVRRRAPDAGELGRAVDAIRGAQRPLIVSGGGTIYSGASDALGAFAQSSGIPVAETQAGKGALPYDHPCAVGAIGVTGSSAAGILAAEADLVIGIGTRYSDFTTSSRTGFAAQGVRFVNLNVASFDAHKLSALPLVADAREGLAALARELSDHRVDHDYKDRAVSLSQNWDRTVSQAYAQGAQPLPAQAEVIGVVNEESSPRDVVVCAAGSMPGDLHKLWRTRDPKGYHVEYGYSCMGYEIAGGLGVKLAAPDREVYVLVGDGSYLMMNTELVTAVAEGIKLIVVLVQNQGYASIGALSESLGSQRFGTAYRYRTATGLDGDLLPVDLAANAASLGADVIVASGVVEFRAALRRAKSATRTTVVYVETDPKLASPPSPAWWDVPVSEVSSLPSTQTAREEYEKRKGAQSAHLHPSEDPPQQASDGKES